MQNAAENSGKGVQTIDQASRCIRYSFLHAASDGIWDGLITGSGNLDGIRSEIDTSIFLLAVPSVVLLNNSSTTVEESFYFSRKSQSRKKASSVNFSPNERQLEGNRCDCCMTSLDRISSRPHLAHATFCSLSLLYFDRAYSWFCKHTLPLWVKFKAVAPRFPLWHARRGHLGHLSAHLSDQGSTLGRLVTLAEGFCDVWGGRV